MTEGHVIAGGVISRTTIVRAHTALLPQSSVAVQVLVVLYVLAQVPGVVTSANVIVTFWSHASVAVAAPNTGEAGQSIGEVTEGQVIEGGVISLTTIVRAHTALLPQSSVAVQVLVTLYVLAQVPGVVTSANVIVTF